jgi:integrase
MVEDTVKQGKVITIEPSLSEAWVYLNTSITNRYDRSFMNQFGSYCSTSRIEPFQVSDDIMAGFERWAVEDGRTPSRAKQLRRDVTKVWNRLSETQPDWPQIKLALVNSRPPASVSIADLPKTFNADLERFLTRAGRKNIFDTTSLKALSPVSQYDRQNKILLMTTILIESGMDPHSIKGLRDLVTPEAREAILGKLWERSNETANAHFYNLARILTQIAKYWAKVSEEELALFKAAEANLRPEKTGMTPKNEARLRVLTAPANIHKLVSLTNKVIASFDHSRPSVLNAVEVQSAIAIAILLIAPIREKNLAALDIERNLHRVRDEEWFLVIPKQDVKNKEDLTFPIPQTIVELIKIYLGVYRPLLLKQPSTKIFISLNGKPKTPAEIGAQLPKFIKRHTGLVMNVHLFRHFAAYLYLKANPGHYEPVRHLLAHKDIATTIRFYTKLEQIESFRQYDSVIDNYRKDVPHAP